MLESPAVAGRGMSHRSHTVAFALLAALLVGAVFLLQPETEGERGVRARHRAQFQAPEALSETAVARVGLPTSSAAGESPSESPLAPAVAVATDEPTVHPLGGASVHLRVLGLDGRPVADREVRLGGARLDGPAVRRTDGAGELLLEALHPGPWTFTTWPEGDELARAGIEGSFERRFEFQSARQVELADGERLELVLGERGPEQARLHGRLTRAGIGVAGTLELRHTESGAVRATETDAEGRFETRLDTPGTWRVLARRDAAVVRRREPSPDERARAVSQALLIEMDDGTALVRELEVGPGLDLRLDLELPTGSITGSVLGADGRPAAALVELWPSADASAGALARVHVRPPRARFEFQDVGPGGWELRVGDYGFAALTAFAPGLRVAGQGEDITLARGEALEHTLQLAPAGHRVGRVTDAAGRGVEGALVLVWHAAAPGEPRTAGISIEDGRFWTPALLPGALALVAFAGDDVSPALELEHVVGSASGSGIDLELRLGPGAFVEIEGVALRPSLSDAGGRDFGALARARAHGWSCGPLPPGPWRLAIARPDGSRADMELALAAGERRSLRP